MRAGIVSANTIDNAVVTAIVDRMEPFRYVVHLIIGEVIKITIRHDDLEVCLEIEMWGLVCIGDKGWGGQLHRHSRGGARARLLLGGTLQFEKHAGFALQLRKSSLYPRRPIQCVLNHGYVATTMNCVKILSASEYLVKATRRDGRAHSKFERFACVDHDATLSNIA
jgi:hypothetical protein